MISFMILLIALAIIAIVVGIIMIICGGAFVAVFGDLIVCVLIIWFIVQVIKKIREK